MPYCANCGQAVAAVSYAPCPRCGRPSNGAPASAAPAAPPRSTNTAAIVIGVVFGLMALVAVLGIVAAIAIPNLLTAQQRAKQKRTMADIRSVAVALEAWAVDNGSYPAGSLDDIERQLAPKYMATVPRLDGWGHPFRYDCWSSTGSACDSYAIGSAAKDGIFARDSLQDYAGAGTTTNFDDDIIFSNGGFTQYPLGAQR